MAGRFLILCYHHIGETSDDNPFRRYYVNPDSFMAQMGLLVRMGVKVMRLSDAVIAIRRKAVLPGRALVLTFDDGYRSLIRHVRDTLISHNFPATIFVSTASVGGVNDWDKGVLDDREIISPEEIKELSGAGFDFQSHSRRHIRLTGLSDGSLGEELAGSLKEMEAYTSGGDQIFSYPFSAYDERVKRAVKKAGFICACTCDPGVNTFNTDLYALKRVEIDSDDTLAVFAGKMIKNYFFGRDR